MSESSRYLAVHELDEQAVKVHADTGSGEPAVCARYRVPDQGTASDILRAHGWRIVSSWSEADDVPSGARRAMVEPGGERL